jgi:catechol 2,3-dioxygenase-like lactoylglutathione lyase family enzyme
MSGRNLRYVMAARVAGILLFGLALLWGLGPHSVLGQSDVGTLHVTIRDRASGQVVPAMICITSLADHTWRVPPDGLEPAPYVINQEFIAGRWKSIEFIAGDKKPWFPGDPGPPVLMNFYAKKPNARVPRYYGGPSIPFWKEPAAYFVSKPFSITLPPGKWRLAVMRGYEYLPVYEDFTIAAGQNLDRDIQLVRWVNMAKEGWYSADPHVHSWRIAPSQDEYIMTWERAMDLHMLCVLDYCVQGGCGGAVQSHYGEASRYHQGDRWLASGVEDPREDIQEQGHVQQMDIQKPIHNPKKYQLYSYTFDKVHAEGGLIGYDHLAWSLKWFRRNNPDLHPGWDKYINTIRHKVDFFVILEQNNLGLVDYYDYLDLGVKLTAVACSDYPEHPVGEAVTYAYTGPDGTFTPDAWYAAVKRGRTFVTNGPMLTLTVNKAMPGDELPVGKSATLHVHAEAWAPESIGAPKVLEIVAEGRVIRSVESRGPHQEKLVADFDLPAGESQWIAARTTAFNGAVAHTTPVYVIVNGQSFIDRAHVHELVAKQLEGLDWIEQKRLDDASFTTDWGPGVVSAVRRDAEKARARFLSLEAAPERPAITGIANIAIRVSNLDAARNYYGHVLGYDEFSVKPDQDSGLPEVIYYKVNDHQYIEISPGLKEGEENRLIHIGFETSNAQRLRDYLASHGVEEVPPSVTKDLCGNLSFTVKDPDGHEVEFVQYLPDSIQGRNFGNFMPDTRLSDHILHVGFHVTDRAKEDRFYEGILGFRLLWQGGPEGNPAAWISYLVPDGSDWLEYMTTPNPNRRQLGGMNHFCLEVKDIQKPYEAAIVRGYTPPHEPEVARDGRWLANFFDPDGTRTELMIRKPVEKPCCTELHDPFISR